MGKYLSSWEKTERAKHWKLMKEETDATKKRLEESAKGSCADRDYFSAALTAKRSAESDGLFGVPDEEGMPKFTVQQGLKAACYGREDAAATLIIQYAILKRLDYTKHLLWLVIFLLAYIAYRLS